MFKLFVVALIATLPLHADWIYEDENGDRFPMIGDGPNPNPEETIFSCEEDIFPLPFPFPEPDRKDDYRLDSCLCGKFYVSTDNPNVWIEVDDSEIGLED